MASKLNPNPKPRFPKGKTHKDMRIVRPIDLDGIVDELNVHTADIATNTAAIAAIPAPTPAPLYLEVDITSTTTTYSDGRASVASGILAMGTSPIELLPVPGAGAYYKYSYTLEKSGDSTPGGTIDFFFIGTGTSYIGNLFDKLSFQNNVDGTIFGSNESSEVSNGTKNYTTLGGINETVMFTSYNAANPVSSLSTFKFKITYTIETFG